MYSTKYGWELDHIGVLVPRTVPSVTLSASPAISHLIHCNCEASGCRTAARSCTKIGCTIVCPYEGAEACTNPLRRSQTEEEPEKTIADQMMIIKKKCDDTTIYTIILLKSVCRCSQTSGRNSCSIVSGYVSNCSHRLAVHPVTSSLLSSA